MSSTRLCRCLHALVAAGIVACGSEPPPSGPDLAAPAAILFTPDSLRLLYNDTARVRAVVVNVQGDTLPNAAIAFASSDTTVASVDSGGLVHALAAGVSDMTISSGAVTESLLVRVRVNGTLVVSPHIAFIQSTDTVQLTVVVRDSNGTVVPFAPVQYRSVDPAIARVTPAGRVTFGGSAGSVMIQVSSAGRTDGALVTGVVRRVPTEAARLVRVRGNIALTLASRYGDVTLQRLDLTTGVLTNELFFGQSSFDDLVVDGTLTRAYLADPARGEIVAVDLVADTVHRVTVAPAFFGPRTLALGPGDSVIFFSADSQLYRMSLKTFSITPAVTCSFRFEGMIANDSMVYGYCQKRTVPTELREFNMRTNSAGRLLQSDGGFGKLALSPNGQKLYMFEYGSVKVWDLVSGDSIARIPIKTGYGTTAIAVQPTTGFVWLSSGLGARVHVIDPVTGQVMRTLQPGGDPVDLAFNSSGTGVIANPHPYYPTGWIDLIR